MELDFVPEGVRVLPLNDETLLVEKWDWDYGEALTFQKNALEWVRSHRSQRIFVTCNHPHVFTYGRGLQKGKESELKTLVEFDQAQALELPYPYYKINRGGGLTFHHPGQWIFYPIVNLNHPRHSLKTLTYLTLELAKETLEQEFHVENLDYKRTFLGLWHGESKMASVGIGVEHFVTYHGLALNLFRDPEMFRTLLSVNPCGLKTESYCCLSDFVSSSREELLSRFQKRFISVLSESISREVSL